MKKKPTCTAAKLRQLFLLGILLLATTARGYEIALKNPRTTIISHCSCREEHVSSGWEMKGDDNVPFGNTKGSDTQQLSFLMDDCDCPEPENVTKYIQKARPSLIKDQQSTSGWLGGSRGSGLAFQRRPQPNETTTKWQSMLNDSFVMMLHMAKHLALRD